ncbi:MAG: hypothetical protein IPL32_04355 [Chloracidobacterium sp.]|nr:hypothetical protein [Chloracidobacterium sp.]
MNKNSPVPFAGCKIKPAKGKSSKYLKCGSEKSRFSLLLGRTMKANRADSLYSKYPFCQREINDKRA